MRRVGSHLGCFYKDEYRGWLKQKKYLLQIKAERCENYEESPLPLTSRTEVVCPACGKPSIIDIDWFAIDLSCGHTFRFMIKGLLELRRKAGRRLEARRKRRGA